MKKPLVYALVSLVVLGVAAAGFIVSRPRPARLDVEAASWLDLGVGDSARDLSIVAQGPDGGIVTELRGAVTIPNGSIVAAQGTTICPTRSGMTVADIEIGNTTTYIPIVVYQPVTSFADRDAAKAGLMAMRVRLARGDTIETPLPKAAFWATYFSKDPLAARQRSNCAAKARARRGTVSACDASSRANTRSIVAAGVAHD